MLSNFFIRPAVNIKITGKGINKVIEGIKGKSILHVAELNNIHIPNACEGSGACATCQIYVKKGTDLLSPSTDQENDTLDFAVEVQENSRLACRAIVTADSGDIEVEIPKMSRNII